MFTLPDLATLRLCCLLTSTAYCVVLLVLSYDRRDGGHWLYWAASAGLYAPILVGFELASHALAVALLYGALAVTNMLILAGIRHFDGQPAWRPWMAAPVVATVLGFLVPALVEGDGPSLAWLSRVGGTAGLCVSMALTGGIMVFGRQRTATWGRRIAGLSLLGYLPGYAVAMAADGSGSSHLHLAALLPMLSDQILLAILYLGLLSMSGERAHAVLREMALHDPLTGALNRAGLTARCDTGLPPGTGIILIDVDHFKQINDRHGHAAGDAVLVDLVGRAQALALGPDDAVARLGGDEFVVLLHRTAPGQLQALADRFCREAGAASGRRPGLPPWTASLGVAMASGSLAETLAMADRALYAAKASGRARAFA